MKYAWLVLSFNLVLSFLRDSPWVLILMSKLLSQHCAQHCTVLKNRLIWIESEWIIFKPLLILTQRISKNKHVVIWLLEIDWQLVIIMLIKCQLRMIGMPIEYWLRCLLTVPINSIDQHSTMDIYSTRFPFCMILAGYSSM